MEKDQRMSHFEDSELQSSLVDFIIRNSASLVSLHSVSVCRVLLRKNMYDNGWHTFACVCMCLCVSQGSHFKSPKAPLPCPEEVSRDKGFLTRNNLQGSVTNTARMISCLALADLSQRGK